jgi:cbb3-type cytochrome oxidase maturation protein
MEVLILTLFVSLTLAGLGVGFFVWSVAKGTGEHSDRLALLPLEDDDAREGADASLQPASDRPARSHF